VEEEWVVGIGKLETRRQKLEEESKNWRGGAAKVKGCAARTALGDYGETFPSPGELG